MRGASRARLAPALLAMACLAGTAAGADEVARPEVVTEEAPFGIRLERILATRGDLGRGRWLRRLTGRADPALFRRPFGVAWDGDALVVSDPGRGEVVRIDEKNRIETSTPADLFASPIGVAACADGVLVADSVRGRVALLDRRLRLMRWVAEGLERPTGVACAEGLRFVVETGRHRVLLLEPATDRVVLTLGRRGAGEGEFNYPTVVAFGDRTLWVGDTLNFRIQGFEPSNGDVVESFGRLGDAAGEMPRLKGIGVDAAGRLWSSDAHLDQIAVYRDDGVFLTALGEPGHGPGQFAFPAGVAPHPDGRVAVVDSLNRRVQVFRMLATAAQGGFR